MIIEKAKTNYISINDIKTGECFTVGGDSNIYMKVSLYDDNNEGSIRILELKSGFVFEYDVTGKEIMHMPNAKVVY